MFASLVRRGAGIGLAAHLAMLAGPGWTPPSAAAAPEIFDPDAPPDTPYRLAPFLSFGAEIEIAYDYRKNLSLHGGTDDDASFLAPELSLALSFDPDPRIQAYLNVVVSRELVWKIEADQSKPSEDVALTVQEAFLWIRSLPGGLSLQLGRQRFEDERQWLYDEELDAVRIGIEHGPFAVELSASRDNLVRENVLSGHTPDRINNYVLLGTYRPREELTVEAYVIARDNRDANQSRPVFVGLRAWGEPIEDLDYWVDLGYAAGREGSNRIRGWGVDLGATYEFQVGPKPALTLGFAFGTGDRNPDDGTDRTFRQTGLQDNEADFGGATEFKYYGEVLDPELSNLAILTAGMGIRPSERFSLDVIYHYYVQHRASPTLRNAGLEAEPSGRSRQLGSGVDLVVGLQDLLDRLEIRAVLGYFAPGAAFPERHGGAWVARTEVQFRF